MKSEENPAPEVTPNKNRLVAVLLQVLLSVAVVGCGLALATYYMKTGPQAKPRKRQPSPPLVQVTAVKYRPHQLIINGMGTVIAAKEINLTPGVGGEITAIRDDMVPGGFFARGDKLLTIDPTDYKLAILQLQSEVARGQSDLELEMGNQRIARKEYEILGQEVSEEEKKLMLRQPQLDIKKATLHGIEARLAQAELNLMRTQVTAPFNGVVLSKSVNLGTRVSESTVLARLIGTDEFWLKLAIPVDQLKWIIFPAGNTQQGSTVKIYLQEKVNGAPYRTGRVIRLAADLEEQGRMAAVYVAVEDPLSRQPENSEKPKILLGSFVRADIEGTVLPSVVPIDRDHLRDDDSIWLMSDDNTLEIRNVDIVARTMDQVLIGSGLKNGERLIVSGLSSPVTGTPIKLMQEEGKEQKPDRNPADEPKAGNGEVNR